MLKFSPVAAAVTRRINLRLRVASSSVHSWNSCQNLTAEKMPLNGQVFHSLLFALSPVDCGNMLPPSSLRHVAATQRQSCQRSPRWGGGLVWLGLHFPLCRRAPKNGEKRSVEPLTEH